MSIVLDQVTKRYQAQAVVNDVSLDVNDGEFLVLLGPSGSGKSTLLRAIAGLTEIDHGRVSLHGRDVTHTNVRQREVGFVFQHYALFRHMSVGDNIEFALRVRRVPASQRVERRRELLRLAQHPRQRAKLAADPTLIPGAFQEILRYDMPTQLLGRTVVKDVSLHGETMRAGQSVVFLYASANRDEREFADPDRFDVLRRPPRILSFGAGAHQCLGRHVANMEGRVCFEEILARFPEYEVLEDQAVRLHTEFVQGFASLPVRIGR